MTDPLSVPLDQRKKQILFATVYEYIVAAEPVSSKLIAEKYLPGVSSATVRNELAVLEDLDYLKQPYRSAGRVPTDLGYRHYVDNLTDLKLSPVEETFIQCLYKTISEEVENLLRETSLLLAKLTKYVAVVFAPFLSRSSFKHLDLVLLSPQTALLVLITDAGYVEKKILKFVQPVEQSNIERAEKILNEKLKSLNLEEIKKKKPLIVKSSPPELKRLLGKILGEIISTFARDENEKIFLDGTARILQQPEFASLEKVQVLLETLEQRYTLLQLLRETLQAQQVVVRIGSENGQLEMKDWSFVAANYSVGGQNLGTLGILGPTRMNYPMAISTVLCIAKNLSEILESHN